MIQGDPVHAARFDTFDCMENKQKVICFISAPVPDNPVVRSNTAGVDAWVDKDDPRILHLEAVCHSTEESISKSVKKFANKFNPFSSTSNASDEGRAELVITPCEQSDISEVKHEVVWVWHRDQACWIQGDRDVADVVSPILHDALKAGNDQLVRMTLEALQKPKIFHGSNAKTQMDRQNILARALLMPPFAEGQRGQCLSSLTRTCLSKSKLAMELLAPAGPIRMEM